MLYREEILTVATDAGAAEISATESLSKDEAVIGKIMSKTIDNYTLLFRGSFIPSLLCLDVLCVRHRPDMGGSGKVGMGLDWRLCVGECQHGGTQV